MCALWQRFSCFYFRQNVTVQGARHLVEGTLDPIVRHKFHLNGAWGKVLEMGPLN